MKKIFIVEGMHCASCSTLLNKTLSKKKGVYNANVNLSTKKALVEYDEKNLDSEKIIQIIRNSGYDAFELTEKNKDNISKKEMKAAKHQRFLFLVSLVLTIPVFLFSMVFMSFPYGMELSFILTTVVQFYVGWQFYRGMISGLRSGTANMDTLVAIGTSAAYFYSVYQLFFVAQPSLFFETSAMLITFILLGRYLEEKAKGQTSTAIKKLINLNPKKAVLLVDGVERIIAAEEIKVGDILVVKAGEQIPTDGIILEGHTSIDESMISGESIPVEKNVGDTVIGATLNKTGFIKIKATKVGGDTVLNQIIKLVENAQMSKAPIQRFADIVASYFVPVVVVLAILVFIFWWIVIGMTFEFALTMGIAVVIISCPCAFGLATPTAIMVGTGKGADNGILIKNAEVLEKAGKLNVVMFDKTGTLTVGKPKVTDIVSFGMQEKDILNIAYSMEKGSDHPLADAIVYEAKQKKLAAEKMTIETIAGKGLKAKQGRNEYLFGNQKLVVIDDKIQKEKIETLESQGKTVMVLSKNKKIIGIIAVADVLKDTTKQAIYNLKKQGLETYMITGDNKRTANAIAKEAGIDNVFAEVMPDQKAEKVKELQEQGKIIAFVGDGINDAVALTQADIGIAMSHGTDVAIESGNIILMKNDLIDVGKSIKLSKMTINKIHQNFFWALAYNVIGIPIAAGALFFSYGLVLRPELAGIAMALSSVSVVTNSILLKFKKLD